MLFDVTFDLDGVLADTFEANREAYAAVGVEFERRNWGRPWHAWLDDPDAHAAKQEIYSSFLVDHLKELPGAPVVRDLLVRRYHVGVITNASLQSAGKVLGMLELPVSGVLCEHKVMHLANTRPFVHVDDQEIATAVRTIQYAGESFDVLLNQVEAFL